MLVSLPDLARSLSAFTGMPAPPYRVLWMKIVDGQIPAEKTPTGRYVADVEQVAKALGLTERAAPIRPQAAV